MSIMDEIAETEKPLAAAAGEVAEADRKIEEEAGLAPGEVARQVIDFLKTETGPEDDYVNHPLNIWKSEGIGQMLRGITGFVGKSLRLAILDVIFGYIKFSRERKGAGGVV